MRLIDTFRERRPFPGQDPWVVAHDGSLLLVQSAGGNRRIVVKRFQDLDRMDRNVEKEIWAPAGPSRHRRHVWAPELHAIEGRWYVYFAASDGRAANHRTYALVADDPLGPYQELGPVGDPRHDVWAIDLTVFSHAGRLHAIWSGWDGLDDGFPQNLYIAPMADPWTISGERRCLSRPQHGWEMSVDQRGTRGDPKPPVGRAVRPLRRRRQLDPGLQDGPAGVHWGRRDRPGLVAEAAAPVLLRWRAWLRGRHAGRCPPRVPPEDEWRPGMGGP